LIVVIAREVNVAADQEQDVIAEDPVAVSVVDVNKLDLTHL
jgi:hypothetical protein